MTSAIAFRTIKSTSTDRECEMDDKVFYVQFVELADNGNKYTEQYNSEEERDIAIGDAKADGYIAVRLWEVLVDAL